MDVIQTKEDKTARRDRRSQQKRKVDDVIQHNPTSPIKKRVPLSSSEDEGDASDMQNRHKQDMQNHIDEILGKVRATSPQSQDAISSNGKGTMIYSSVDYQSLVSAENLNQTKIIHKLVTQLMVDWEGTHYNTILDRIPGDEIRNLITSCLSAALVSDTFETPLLSEIKRNELKAKATRLDIAHKDWSVGNPSEVLIPNLLWRIKGTTRAPRDSASFLEIMKSNPNPFGYTTQEISWSKGLFALSEIDTLASPWVQTLKEIIRELYTMSHSEDDPLSPVWQQLADAWSMVRTTDAIKLYPTSEKLAQGFAMALQGVKSQLQKDTDIKYLDKDIISALKYPKPYKTSAKAKGSGTKAYVQTHIEKPRTKQTSSDKAVKCRKCGNDNHESKDCRLTQDKHPDINTENVPWSESTIGKSYLAKGRHSVRKNSYLVGGVFVDRSSSSSSTAFATGNNTYDIITHISNPNDTNLPSPYIQAKAVSSSSDGVAIDKVLLDTGSIKANYIDTDTYHSLTPIFGLGKRTTHCACAAFRGICQSNLIKLDFSLQIFCETSNSNFNFTLSAYVIDSPVPLIIGRPDIIRHQLFVRIPSQLYIGKDASRLLADHCMRKPNEAEYCMLVKERQELLDAENYSLDEELVGEDPTQPWDPEISSALPTDIQGPKSLQLAIKAVLAEFSDVFSTTLPPEPAKVTPMRINIIEHKFRECKMQRTARIQSAVKNAEIHRQVNKMIANNLISPSQAHKFSQVLLTPKKNNTWRFCIDYRKLNDCTEPSGWPIPIIDEMIQRLGKQGAKYYGILDFTQGFYQCPIDDESQIYTAFRTFGGAYVWKRVPMGLKGAPAYFQSTMQNEVLNDLIYDILEIYIDDILLFAKNEEEYIANLRKLFERLRAKNVKINPAKTALGLSEVEFVGHTLTQHGIKFSDKKRHEILNVEIPNTQRQMKHFVGLAQYYSKSVPDFVRWTAPFHLMTRNYTPAAEIIWTEDLRKQFKEFQTALFNMPSRWFQDSISPVFLHTDASKYGIGGYLYQLHTDPVTGIKSERVIEFISKALTPQQKKWNTTDQEAFAIFFCITKLQNRLRDITFTLRTDHRNLLFINDASSARVMRWKMDLQEYMFNIEHIAGKDNVVADNLSRIPNITHDSDEDRVDMLFALDELEIPFEVKNAFDKVHNSSVGHMGLDKTMERIKQLKITHPYLRNIVRTLLRSCDICQKQSRVKNTFDTTIFTSSSDHPMQRINMDTIGPFPKDKYGYKFILTIIDTFSRWVCVYPTRSTSAEEAAVALLQHTSMFGNPSQILTDNGSQFMNDLFLHLFRLTGIEGLNTIPYSKEENSIVERANKEIQRHLEALCYDRTHADSWSSYLPIVQRIMNASVHSATGQKPASLLFANMINLDKGIFLPLDEQPPPHNTNVSEWLADITRASQDLISLAQRTQDDINSDNLASRHMKRKHRKCIPQSSIQIGDLVLLERPNARSKLELIRKGPVTVTDTERDAVTVQDSKGNKKRVRINNIVKYIPLTLDQVQTSQTKDNQRYFVEKILGFVTLNNKKGKHKYLFTVKWEGYDETTQEPFSNLQNNSVWIEWATSHKNPQIRALVPK